MSRRIRCRCCGQPGPHKGHGYREACWRRWVAAGRPDTGPPAPVDPADRPFRTRADADTLRTKFADLRTAGHTVAAAAMQLQVSRATAYRYETARKKETAA